MVSKGVTLPAGQAPASHSDDTVAPSSEGVFMAATVSASDPFVFDDTVDLRTEAIDSATLEFEFDAIQGASRYQTSAVLGTGGMGEVRLSLDQRIGRRVARKTMHASRGNSGALRRFLREARVQGQLEHPAIVPVYDLDVDDDEQVYFTMKRVRGETLERILEHLEKGDTAWTRRFGTRRLLSAFAQVCLAVDYAHTRRVVHRDLKPSNVMLGSFGEVYLLDWGLAKVLGGELAVTGAETDDDEPPVESDRLVIGASGAITAHGALVGTVGYMAPEQLAGRAAKVDSRTDVYALGAILFEILTLTRFRRQGNVAALLASFAADEVRRPSERVATVPPELDDLCARALAVKPENRPRTARELAEAVELYLDGEHDTRLRRDLAASHVASARESLEAPADGATGRVGAMREALKALALDADQPEAQRLLLDVLTNVSDEVPAAARPELDAVRDRSRGMTAQIAMQGMFWWLAVLPFVIYVGVLSWPAVGATAMATLAALFYARHLWKKKGSFGAGPAVLLTGMVAAVVALTSCYLGPFVITPTTAVGASLILAISATKRERRLGAAIFVAGGLLPYAAEILGIWPPAYTFEPGRILVAARAVALPHWPTMGAMAYSTVAWTLITVTLIGRMRDTLNALQQRQFLQAWYLRQLFPASAGERRA